MGEPIGNMVGVVNWLDNFENQNEEIQTDLKRIKGHGCSVEISVYNIPHVPIVRKKDGNDIKT